MTKPFDHTLRDIRYGECLAEQFGALIAAETACPILNGDPDLAA